MHRAVPPPVSPSPPSIPLSLPANSPSPVSVKSLFPPSFFPPPHAGHVHILECHPTDPALAFSASYDGTVAVWDTRSGTVLRRFSRWGGRPRWGLLGRACCSRRVVAAERPGCCPTAVCITATASALHSTHDHACFLCVVPCAAAAARRAPTAAAGQTPSLLLTATSLPTAAPSPSQVRRQAAAAQPAPLTTAAYPVACVATQRLARVPAACRLTAHPPPPLPHPILPPRRRGGSAALLLSWPMRGHPLWAGPLRPVLFIGLQPSHARPAAQRGGRGDAAAAAPAGRQGGAGVRGCACVRGRACVLELCGCLSLFVAGCGGVAWVFGWRAAGGNSSLTLASWVVPRPFCVERLALGFLRMLTALAVRPLTYPHPAARGALCDALGNPYPEPLQEAFRAQRVLSAPTQACPAVCHCCCWV